ncbi:MAG: cation transport protein ChaC [Candidatus Azotimanducaceae bacterium]|jgi:cation transport protein ChaC
MIKDEPLWVFGYGSILWKTDFPFIERRLAKLSNHGRRFWQASIDHRGTIELPGLVVTLIPNPGEDCWGVNFRISRDEWPDVISHLDHREKGGYERHQVSTLNEQNEIINATTYIADQHNSSFIGESPLDVIAQRIRDACGPSGSNKEYILQLHQTLTELGIADDHISKLAQLVR